MLPTSLLAGVSYDQVKLKWKTLQSPINNFDGTATRFNLVSQDSPIAPPSAQHLIVSVYGEVLIPTVDYSISGSQIVFTTGSRTNYLLMMFLKRILHILMVL